MVTMSHSPNTCQGNDNRVKSGKVKMRRRNKLWPKVELMSHAGNRCKLHCSHCEQSSAAQQHSCLQSALQPEQTAT